MSGEYHIFLTRRIGFCDRGVAGEDIVQVTTQAVLVGRTNEGRAGCARCDQVPQAI